MVSNLIIRIPIIPSIFCDSFEWACHLPKGTVLSSLITGRLNSVSTKDGDGVSHFVRCQSLLNVG